MSEYLVSLSYFSALSIVCLVLYAFTHFLPTPENNNKARSTYFFRLILLFTIAAFESLLLRFEYLPLAAIVINNFFVLLIAYTLMFAIYTRYDCEVNKKHYLLCVAHSMAFMGIIYLVQTHVETGYLRAAIVLINICIPYAFTIRKCNQQFKKHRLGDKVLYGSLLIILLLLVLYIFLYTVFFSHEKQIPLSLYFVILLCCTCVLFFGFALSIIYSLIGKLRKEIITDKLTGAKNRNYLNEVSLQLFSLARRKQSPLSLVLCDIDWFKNINDTYGHAAGDKVLVDFSKVINDALRADDVFIRIGGEEFVILLPYNDCKEAMKTAERLREIINQHTINVDIDKITISASFGVTQVNLTKDIDANINCADMALYEAKRTGRNKVIAYNN